ncbi:MAG: dihydroorotate dehydrogenase-like protein [Candidatus Limnocylindrales bacterium]
MSVDLRTTHLGLRLRSPLVASASPLNGVPETARRVEDAGAGAIVLPSLFEEEILNEDVELNRSIESGTEQFAEALDYFPRFAEFEGAGDRYLNRLEQIKRQASIPVIASLNATSAGGWVRHAHRMQEAGADALELNVYRVAADPSATGTDIETADLDLIAAVRAAVTIPLAVKLSPFYSSVANFAGRAVECGADGLVLFNRFYQPDLDLETLDVVSRVELSGPADLRLPLRWIAILRPQVGPRVALAATSGVHSDADALKVLMVGADVAMMTSALLRNGPGHIRVVERELREWMEEHDYESVDQLRGSASQAAIADPAAFERANYMKALQSWSTPSDLTTVAIP